MKKILIGNDITLRWVIKNKENQPINLPKTKISLKILHQELPEATFIPQFTVDGNEISLSFPAEKQKHLGIYHLQLTVKDGNTVKIVNRETFCLCDIYECDAQKLNGKNEDIEIEVIHVENEVSFVNGKDGKTAYEIAVSHGFSGTEEEWLNSFSQNLQQVMDKGSVTDKTITAPSISSDKEDSYNYSLGKYGLTVKSNYVNSNYATSGIRIDPVDGGYIIITGNAPKGIRMFFPNENNGGSMELNNGFIKFSNRVNSSQLSNSDFIFRNDALKLSETGVSMSDYMKKSFQEVLEIPEKKDTGWINVTFQNGTSNFGGSYSPVQYRKIGNRIFVQGMIKGGSDQNNTSGYILFNLPVKFRPKFSHIFNVLTGNSIGRIDVASNGDVKGVIYRAQWASMEFSFFID